MATPTLLYKPLLILLLALWVLLTTQAGFSAEPIDETGQVYLPLIVGGNREGTANPVTPTPVTPTPITPTPTTPTPVTPTPTKPPLSVAVTLATTAAITAEIGAEGGLLQTSSASGVQYALVIPPDALDFPEVITMTLVNQIAGLPLAGGFVGAISLEPDGLWLYEKATLWITPTQPLTGELQVGFAYEGGGAEFYLRPLGGARGQAAQLTATSALTQTIDHLAGYGAAAASRSEVTQQQQHVPSDPIAQAEQSMILGPEDLPSPNGFLLEKLETVVAKAVNDPSYLDEALRRFDQISAIAKQEEWRGEFAQRLSEAETKLIDALITGERASAQRCLTEKKPEEGFRLLRWLNYARKFGYQAILVPDLAEKLRNCLTFKLTFDSDITEGGFGDTYGYHYHLISQLTLQATTGMRATGRAPLNWQVVEWIGRPWVDCSHSIVGAGSTYDAQGAGLGLAITPVSRTSPAVKITLRYDPGLPGETTQIQCPGAPGITRNTNGWYYYFDKLHFAERLLTAGYQARAQVVGAGSFPGWTYHQTTTGPGGQQVIENTTIALEHTPIQ